MGKLKIGGLKLLYCTWLIEESKYDFCIYSGIDGLGDFDTALQRVWIY